MSVKTPCQLEPELWVSDIAESRRTAARECEKCPAFDWCAREAIKVDPSHGVWAGKDYSKYDAVNGDPKPERGWDQGFVRRQHARFTAGERDELATTGEREYHRRRKNAQRAA